MTQPGDAPAPAPAPVVEPVAAPEPVVEPVAAPAAPTHGVEPGTWTQTLSEEQQGFVQNKGFETPEALLTSYQNLESMVVGFPAERLLKLPADLNDQEAMAEVHTRLGRPDSAEGYEFPAAPEGDGVVDLNPMFRELAFKNGLPKGTAESIAEGYTTFMAEKQQERIEEMNVRDAAQMSELQKDWGPAFNERKLDAERFVHSGKWTDQQLTQIRDLMGEGFVYETAYALGRNLGEPVFVGAGGPGAVNVHGMSPGQAKAKITELKSNTEFMGKYMAGDKASENQMRVLHERAFPEPPKA